MCVDAVTNSKFSYTYEPNVHAPIGGAQYLNNHPSKAVLRVTEVGYVRSLRA